MHQIKIILIIILLGCSVLHSKDQVKPKVRMVLIPGGEYSPFFKEKKGIQVLQPFYIDTYPVTNLEYLEFVKANPQWQRSKVKRIFADNSYLKHWKSNIELGEEINPNSPVTNVSWFSAKAYCKWAGKRLPTIAEWEFIASASEKQVYGLNNSEFKKKILQWYSKPTPKKIPEVKSTEPNYWKVYDMHGLVWEWVEDFNSILVSGESRGGSNSEKNLFCGGGSIPTSDPGDYAAFMRFAMRSSLEANYTVCNLGFRCVKDISQNNTGR